MRRALLLFPVLSLLALPACLELQRLDAGVCGNGVVETGEDCEPVENEEFTCRPPEDARKCTIACNAGGACPAGYGCGTDDVCRRHGGSFEQLPFAQAGSKADMLLGGDFDADGRTDVVAVEPGRARIYFSDGTGNLDQTTVTSPRQPSIGKMGALAGGGSAALDTTDDLVLPLGLGIGALLSGGNRSFKSKAYGSVPVDTIELGKLGEGVITDAFPIAVDALPTATGPNAADEAIVLLDLRSVADPTFRVTALATFGSGNDQLLFPFDESRLENLSGPPVTGNFDKDPCEELVLSMTGSRYLRVYKLCKSAPTFGYQWARNESEREAVIAEIDVGGKIVGPVFAYDMNWDNRLDLAVSVSVSGPEGESTMLRVAYGDGTGKFGSSWQAAPDGKTRRYADLPGSLPFLALADLDGDTWPDGARTDGILRGYEQVVPNSTTLATFQSWYGAQRPWTDVAYADINGDGLTDVIASSDGATDIDVLFGHTTGFWNPTQIATDGTVSQLATGDFDGDLVADVVFDDILSPAESLIMISYGRSSGGPEEATEVASFAQVERLFTGDIHTFGADSITDLGCTSADEAGARSFSYFPGTATRLLQAPLVLSDEKRATHIPLATGSGSLATPGIVQTAARRDVVVLAASESPDTSFTPGPLAPYQILATTLRVWALYGGEEEAGFSRLSASACTFPDAFFFPRLEAAHAIEVAPSAAGGSGLVVAMAPYMDLTGDQVQIRSILAAVTFDGASCSVPGAGQASVSEPGELYYRVRTADLNTNGSPEIIALRKTYDPDELKAFLDTALTDLISSEEPPTSSGPSPLNVRRSELVVLWDGDFEQVFTLPEESWDARDFAVGEIDGDGSPDLLVLDGGRIRRFEVENGTHELLVQPDVELPVEGPQAVLVTDVDGDGIHDVAVRGASLQVFRGLPPEGSSSRAASDAY